MNNGNNSFSAYTLSGRPRPGVHDEPVHPRRRRIALMIRGGTWRHRPQAERLDMPPVRTSPTAPAPRGADVGAAVFGNPEIPENHPRYLWPGGGTWTGSGRLVLDVQALEPGDGPLYSGPPWRRKPLRSPNRASGAARMRLREAVLRTSSCSFARADGGLLRVRRAEAGVRAPDPPDRRAALRRAQWRRMTRVRPIPERQADAAQARSAAGVEGRSNAATTAGRTACRRPHEFVAGGRLAERRP